MSCATSFLWNVLSETLGLAQNGKLLIYLQTTYQLLAVAARGRPVLCTFAHSDATQAREGEVPVLCTSISNSRDPHVEAQTSISHSLGPERGHV